VLEHGLALPSVAAYLRNTRGPGSEYLRYPSDRYIRFWGDFLESLEMSDISTSHIKLSIVDSTSPEIETIKIGGRSHLILDQAIIDVFTMMTSVAFHVSSPRLDISAADWGGSAWWVHALFANRFLNDGRRAEAVVQGNLCARARQMQGDLTLDEHRRDRWVEIQVAFSLGHEVGHCTVFNGNQVLARSGSASFEEVMRPYVELMDQEDPVEYAQNHESAVIERQIAEYIREVNASLAEHGHDPIPRDPMPTYRGMSYGEKLDLVLSDESGVGEEVVADYLAMSMVARLMAHPKMPFDECLAACVAAIRTTFLLRMIKVLSNSYFDSRFPTKTMAELINEMRIREEFAGFSAMTLSRRQHLREIDDPNGVLSDATKEALELRSSRLAGFLSHMANRWSEDVFFTIPREMHAGRTFEAVNQLRDDPQFRKMATSPNMANVLAEITGIGRSQSSWPAR
jgi:hypothetical protein